MKKYIIQSVLTVIIAVLALLVIAYIAKSETTYESIRDCISPTPSAECLASSDLNKDGKVNTMDILWLRGHQPVPSAPAVSKGSTSGGRQLTREQMCQMKLFTEQTCVKPDFTELVRLLQGLYQNLVK